MRLHEEYILRHKLNIPVIGFDKKSSLFLKSKKISSRWNLFNIIWRPQTGRSGPCFYEFNRLEPLHNGNGAFYSLDKDYYVYWDQYESEINKIVNYYKDNEFVAISGQEQALTVWEIFLYMYDGWLANRMNNTFFEYVEKSTTPTLEFRVRMHYYKLAKKILVEFCSTKTFFDYFKINQRLKDSDEIIGIFDNLIFNTHSQWLEKLINA